MSIATLAVYAAAVESRNYLHAKGKPGLWVITEVISGVGACLFVLYALWTINMVFRRLPNILHALGMLVLGLAAWVLNAGSFGLLIAEFAHVGRTDGSWWGLWALNIAAIVFLPIASLWLVAFYLHKRTGLATTTKAYAAGRAHQQQQQIGPGVGAPGLAPAGITSSA